EVAIGGAADCSFTSDSRNGAANSSGIAASKTLRAWPNFIAPPLSSPSTAKSCSALRAMSWAEISSPSPPTSRLPNPAAARPATPSGRLASLAVRAAVRRGMSVTSSPRWRWRGGAGVRPLLDCLPSGTVLAYQQLGPGAAAPPGPAAAVGVRGPRPSGDRARVDVELEGGVEDGRARRGVRPVERDEGLRRGEACRRGHARGRGAARDADEPGGRRGPHRVPRSPLDLHAAEAGGAAGEHERPDDPGAVAHPHH